MSRKMTRPMMGALAVSAIALSAQAGADATRRNPVIPYEPCLVPGSLRTNQEAGDRPPVLVEGLGYAGLEADSDDQEARAWFAQGVRLIWAFDESEAVRAFQQAQRLDPGCALCVFGEAWARGPTINLKPRAEELGAARAAARRAMDMSSHLSPRDRLLIEAMALRTRDGDGFSNEAYATFMERAAQLMPEDDTLAVMAADARMVTWGRGNRGKDTTPQRLLERVLARNPDHSGAIHFYIHLTDWIDRQELAVPYAERLGRIAPAASHLLHMPSHSFYGVGRYKDAAAVNVAAIAADRAYQRRVRPPASDYRRNLLAHDMQFAIESALIRGDGATAARVSQQYRDAFLTGEVEPGQRLLGSATWYAKGLHGDVAEVLAEATPEQALDRTLHHYARGEALARDGNAEAVGAEARAIAEIRDSSRSRELGPRGAQLAEVFQHVLEGRAAMLAGNYDAAERTYRRAMRAQLKAGFGSDPPLYWYSVRRSLAAALLAGGDARGAERQLQASLRHWPDDPLALYALSLAQQRLGNDGAAKRSLARARAVWAGEVKAVPLARI